MRKSINCRNEYLKNYSVLVIFRAVANRLAYLQYIQGEKGKEKIPIRGTRSLATTHFRFKQTAGKNSDP